MRRGSSRISSPLGYRFCFVDEGYQFARGEYATPDGNAFPKGMSFVTHKAEDQGLTFGLWVAPFQVSDRSWVYEHHKDWLVHNLDGEPIHIGRVGGKFEELYALDPTNPGAQDYLRSTYRTLVKRLGRALHQDGLHGQLRRRGRLLSSQHHRA